MKRALYQTQPRLTQDEINRAMERYPRPQPKPPAIRLRYVFLTLLFVGVVGALMVLDPMAKLVGG